MFNNQKFLTRGVDERIPLKLQSFMWSAIMVMDVKKKDYLQIFTLTTYEKNGMKMQHIKHEQEQPAYSEEYDFPCDYAVDEKVYVIDDITHSTMLLAEEY